MIDQIDVTGHIAFSYLRRELDAGKTLSMLIGELPLENGRIIAFVPKLTPDDKVFAFDRGGLYISSRIIRGNGVIAESVENDARQAIEETIDEFLAKNEMRCCLFEHALSEPSDPWLINAKLEFLSFGKEVFFFISNRTRTLELIKKDLLSSESYVFLCALSQLELKVQNNFDPQSELNIDLLRQFVANISSFAVKAYDGEGYLIWKKRVDA